VVVNRVVFDLRSILIFVLVAMKNLLCFSSRDDGSARRAALNGSKRLLLGYVS
jgi:hypothetical protein